MGGHSCENIHKPRSMKTVSVFLLAIMAAAISGAHAQKGQIPSKADIKVNQYKLATNDLSKENFIHKHEAAKQLKEAFKKTTKEIKRVAEKLKEQERAGMALKAMTKHNTQDNNKVGARQPFTCAEDEFACPNGKCIPNSWVCDEEDDCGDSADEPANGCPCLDNEYACLNGFCIPDRWICDGDNDCGDICGFDCDGSDEQDCPCEDDEFTCSSGTCIPRKWESDGDNDCGDLSDELFCGCDDPTGFECPNGLCLPGNAVCDGDNDCGDSFDEENC